MFLDSSLTYRWAQERGVESQISPVTFGSIRGAAAMQHLEPGATALSIPEHCLIHEGTAAASDIVCC